MYLRLFSIIASFVLLISVGKCAGAEEKMLRVAILGNSSLTGDVKESQYQTLERLLKNVREKNVAAVFFSGELVQMFESEAPQKNPFTLDESKNKNTEGQLLPIEEIEKRFRFAKDFVSVTLGQKVPFFPVIGYLPPNTSEENKKVVDAFTKTFGINYPEMAEEGQLAYLVSIGKALFQVLATDWPVYKKGGALDISMLSWVATNLSEKKNDFNYFFFIANQPVFSSLDTFGRGSLRQYPKEQSLFWELLREYRVLAYFSGGEKFYQRVQKGGVWHITSGGAGAPLNDNKPPPFFHYLILTLPESKDEAPKVEVIDVDGRLRDSFPLEFAPSNIYQLRIS